MDDACDIYVTPGSKGPQNLNFSCQYLEWPDRGVTEPLHQPLAVVGLGCGHVDGLRGRPEGSVHTVYCRHVVPVHPHHGLLVHRQPRRLTHRGEPP